MEYIVIDDKKLFMLVEAVNRLLDKNEGWKPQGGIAVCIIDGDNFYIQAMVKGEA